MLIEQDLTTKEISRVGLIGRLQARLKRRGSQEWEQVWKEPIKNKILNAGLKYMANCLMSDTPTKLKYGEIGEGTTAATASDTCLESPILSRTASVLSTDTTAVDGDTAKFVTTFTSDTTSYAVTEYATFESSVGEPALNRVVFAAITLNLNDILEFTYSCQIQES